MSQEMSCSHLECRTVVECTGKPHVFLMAIDPQADVDCEVCRKLNAFDDLLEACKACFRDFSPIWHESAGEVSSCNPADYDKGERFAVYLTREEMDTIKIAIDKAEP